MRAADASMGNGSERAWETDRGVCKTQLALQRSADGSLHMDGVEVEDEDALRWQW